MRAGRRARSRPAEEVHDSRVPMSAPSATIESRATGVAVGRWAFLRSHRAMGIALVLPARAYLALVTEAPCVVTLWYSFHRGILTWPEVGHAWIGIANFRYELRQDPIFRAAIWNTLEITAAIVGGSL